MDKSSIIIAVYVIGLLFGALVFGFWDSDTSPIKAMIGLIWTALFLIALFYSEKKDS
ncbi:hypothetical protein OAJ75_00190 [Candidatus Pelagibacter sp.]|nr:hypothetical protein [Candidatus Pelagibacter sp.]